VETTIYSLINYLEPVTMTTLPFMSGRSFTGLKVAGGAAYDGMVIVKCRTVLICKKKDQIWSVNVSKNGNGQGMLCAGQCSQLDC